MMNSITSLSLENLSLQYGQKTIIDSINLEMTTRELGCLLGPSGCGKSTLLRAIAGFQRVVTGQIRLHNKLVSAPHLSIRPQLRDIGMVFQDIALFPHLTVEQNISFGLQRFPYPERKKRVTDLLELISLDRLKMRYPHELSGGQQQRVALARAMAPNPELLLLDEPFSGLDTELRGRLASEVRQILKQDNISALLVTHDQREAFDFADRIAVLQDGQIAQWDTPYKIFYQPKTPFVAHFVGAGQMLEATISGPQKLICPLGELNHRVQLKETVGSLVKIFVRPDDLVFDDTSVHEAILLAKHFRGAHYLYDVKLSNGSVLGCMVPSHYDHTIGQALGIRLDVEHLVIFPYEQ